MARGGARIGGGLDQRADHRAVDDRDEVAHALGRQRMPGPGERLCEQRVELHPQLAHQRRQVGAPAGADQALVAQPHGVEAAGTRLRAEQQVEHDLDELTHVGGPSGERGALRVGRGELLAAGALDGGRDQVVQEGK